LCALFNSPFSLSRHPYTLFNMPYTTRFPPLIPVVDRAPSRQTGAISIRHYDDGVNPYSALRGHEEEPKSMREFIQRQEEELLMRYAEAEAALLEEDGTFFDEPMGAERRLVDCLPLATSVWVNRSPTSLRTEMVMKRVERERERRTYRKYRDELSSLERRTQLRLRLSGLNQDKDAGASASTSRRCSVSTHTDEGDEKPCDYEDLLKNELAALEDTQVGSVSPRVPKVPRAPQPSRPQQGLQWNHHASRKNQAKDNGDDTASGKFGALKPDDYMTLREEHAKLSKEGAWLRALSEHSAPSLSLGGLHVSVDTVKRLIRPDMFVPLHPLLLVLHPSLTPEKLLTIHRYLGLSVEDQLRASGAYRVTKEDTAPVSSRGPKTRPGVQQKKRDASDLPAMNAILDNNRQLHRLFAAGMEQFCRGPPRLAKRSQERGMSASEFAQFCVSNQLMSKSDALQTFEALAVEASKAVQGRVITVHELSQIRRHTGAPLPQSSLMARSVDIETEGSM
jgi:hypothetical protein